MMKLQRTHSWTRLPCTASSSSDNGDALCHSPISVSTSLPLSEAGPRSFRAQIKLVRSGMRTAAHSLSVIEL
jgi:hypothetical protein